MVSTFIVSIEGNIGSGKSTIIKGLRKIFHLCDTIPIVYVDEPVDEWANVTDIKGTTMLELFYAEPKIYSFSFQMMAFITRFITLRDTMRANPNSIIITERCLLTDLNIFAKMLHAQGSMADVEYTIYKKWFHYFQLQVPVSMLIYVKCSPDICLKRCIERSRAGESSITLEYLTTCNDMHNEWLKDASLIVHNLFDNNTDYPINEIINHIYKLSGESCSSSDSEYPSDSTTDEIDANTKRVLAEQHDYLYDSNDELELPDRPLNIPIMIMRSAVTVGVISIMYYLG